MPDTSGYTAATIQTKQAVASAGNAVAAQVTAGANAIPKSSDSRQDALDQAGRFRDAWKRTVGSLDALVSYAESIESVVDAGNQGAESARAVAGAVQSLADTITVDPTTGAMSEAFETAASTVSFVYGEIAKMRAAQSLEKSLSEAGPAVTRIGELVQMQVQDARRLFILSVGLERDELNRKFGDWRKMNSKLVDRKQRLVTELTKLDTGETSASSRNNLEEQIKNVESTRKHIAPHLEEYDALKSDLEKREKAGHSLLSASETALRTWAAAHDKLVKAVNERKPVTMESLNAAVIETQRLIQRWREL